MIDALALLWYGLRDPMIGHFLVAAIVILVMAAITAVRFVRYAVRSVTKLI